jgi:hypothetical protein
VGNERCFPLPDLLAYPRCMVGQFISFLVVLAGDVLDGEINRTCQFAAGPVQGMQTGATAGVLAKHRELSARLHNPLQSMEI